MPVDISPLLALPAPLAVGITSLTAHGLCFGFTFTYVGSLYAAQHLFGKRKYSAPAPAVSDPNVTVPSGHRDHPDTMRLRMKAVSIATRLCIAGVYWAVKLTGDYDYYDAVSWSWRLIVHPPPIAPANRRPRRLPRPSVSSASHLQRLTRRLHTS